MTVAATALASREDHALLARALTLALGAHGRTAPNPAVGCVIADRDGIVGEGATRPAGGPHAEVVALRAAGDRARGASAYVTLEPCDHHGRTPPCSEALLHAGVRRVVVAHPDPNAVAAGGADRLRAAGVDVHLVDGPLRAAVAAQLEGFLTRVRSGRPHVTLKLAQTADGGLRAPDGQRWITGPAARRAVHRWRRAVDAVLVGSGTVLADDPGLDVREVPLGPRPQPRPVVLDARLRTPPTARVVARGALVVTATPAASARNALVAAGAEVVEVPAAPDAGVDLEAALTVLGERGLSSILAEPGRQLAEAMLAADVVDRLVRHVAPHLSGSATAPSSATAPVRAVPDPSAWRLERAGGAGPDLILQHLRVRSSEEAA